MDDLTGAMDGIMHSIANMPTQPQSGTSIISLSDEYPADYVCGTCGFVGPYSRRRFGDRYLYTRDRCECENAAEAESERQHRIEVTRSAFRAQSGITGDLAAQTFKTFNDRPELAGMINACRSYVSHARDMPWMVLSGPVGVGKSHLALAVGNELLLQLYQVRHVVVPDMFETIKQSYDKRDLNVSDPVPSLLQSDILIIDELGEGSGDPEWKMGQIYRLINGCANRASKMGVIITTNKRNPADLIKAVGKRSVDRIIMKARWFDADAESYRQIQFKKRNQNWGQ